LEYCYIAPKDDELMHYGVKGMHWGIRRYQPYPDGKHGTFLTKRQAKRAQGTMNMNAYTSAVASHYKDKSTKRAVKFMMKAEVANAENKIKKRDRLTRKAQKEARDAQFHSETMKRAQDAVNESIKRLDAGGWNVKSIDKKGMLIANRTLGDIMFRPRLDRASVGGIIPTLLFAPRGTERHYKVTEKFDTKKGMSSQNKHELNNPIKPAHDVLKIKPPKGYEKVQQDPAEKAFLNLPRVSVKKKKR